MSFGCILETRVKENKAGSILKKVFKGWSSITNYEYSRGGRIWLVWNDDVCITPVYKSDQLITSSVVMKGREEFFYTCVYANNLAEDRRELWEDLSHHQDSVLFRGKAWMIVGDFNEILDGEESSGFLEYGRISSGMRDFQRVALHCNLSDMGYQGPMFTWCNKREEGVICKKLDRVLINDVALQKFSSAYSVFEAGGCSDHMRCKIQIFPPNEKMRRPFKYVNAIGKLDAFLPLVQDFWNSTPKLFHSTSALYRFSKKLKNLKPLIRELGKEKLGNLTKKAKEAHERLCEKQNVTLSNPSGTAIQEEAEAYEKWLHVASLEEDFLKQRAKLHWLEVGDQNNKTFHNAIKSRQAQNTIREIRCATGNVVTKQQDIKDEAVYFFSEFLNKVPDNFIGATTEELEELLEFRCSDDDCRSLEAEVSEEEIRRVVFAMPSNKSPGPDGYPVEFFKSTWSIVAQDFIIAIQSVFRYGFLPKGVNSTILALVPKKTDSLEMKDFRPIACCNVIYKVVSKIIANRLKLILPRVVSENQSAFVKGRLLMENVLLASELVKDYHREVVTPRCLMKLDISKAFDSVQWSFVIRSLEAIGVPARFIQWIRLCISTPSFSVQVNGELAGYFQSKRGLRQGCSLSPYLFVLCMNVLSHKIDKAVKEKKFKFHPRCQVISLTHLCFADDLMVFVEGTKDSIEGALSVFEGFAKWSGLSISLEKSTVYMAGVEAEEKRRILRNFPFAEGSLPVRYLGLPLMTQAMKRQDYLPLVERIRSKICSWTSRFLSYAGRLQLIKSVLVSIVNFWASVFRLPSKCIHEVEQLCASFLWTGPDLKSTGAKVSWSAICKQKAEGGLGIRSLKEVNMVYGLKLIWRLLSARSLWGSWIKENLLKKKSFWEIKTSTQMGSWMWRKLLKLRGIARNFYKMEVGNGSSISFWHDHWSEKGVLIEILGDRGMIDMGIRKEATLAEAAQCIRRRRRHRAAVLSEIEVILDNVRSLTQSEAMDVSVWKGKSGYRAKFSTYETWMLIRESSVQQLWARGVWFAMATPKYAFITWLAVLERLSTMDRVAKWSQGIDAVCVLCKTVTESRSHLFFECTYASQLWFHLVGGILGSSHTSNWNAVMLLISNGTYDRRSMFCIRYAFQAAIYAIWRERNRIRHGEKPMAISILKKLTEKGIRNKLSLVKMKGGKGMEGILQFWFQKRN